MTGFGCAVSGCDKPKRYRLYCNMHHRRWKRTGDPGANVPQRETTRYLPGTTCLVDECEVRPDSRGWCKFHYQRWRLHGDPLATMIIYGDDEARFWAKVDKEGTLPASRPDLGPCWIWQRSLDEGGYGWFKADGRMQKAHRWAFSHFVRPVPRHLEVDHLCGSRACVNFEQHLEDVPPLINTRRAAGGNAMKTHCKNGHEFTPANTYRPPAGGRSCRACTARAQRAYRARKTSPPT